MRKIVLISCVSKKVKYKAKAKDLYLGSLFKYSYEYAKKLNPDKIFILSAKYHLLDLEKEIEPYDVTISYVNPKRRINKPHLKVLNKAEKKIWGENVIQQLSEIADLSNDEFTILAGKSYVNPIRRYIVNIKEPLKGKRQGERVKYLKSLL